MNGGTSDTAATAGDPKFPPSGVQKYRVTMLNGAARHFVDVDAATGDEASDKAAEIQPGLKVVHIEPAPQQRETLTVKKAA